MFFDRAKAYVEGGVGGDGIVAFRRAKHQPKGGPAGGNGGRGGHVWAVVNPALNTLHHLRKQVHHRAGKGGRGGGTAKQGARGADLRVEVPPGTLIRDADTHARLADLTRAGQQACVARGGRGGKGNAAFRGPRRQAPRLAENGEPGEARWIELELKLVAEVGIIGVPNAGKSTFIRRVSAARPAVADYPFTTLVPNLGVAEFDHRQRVFVDVPGLVEGAHAGIGLGLEFLRHVERTRLLVHLLDGAAADPLAEMRMIENELRRYSPTLDAKPRVIALNKTDLPQARAWQSAAAQACQAAGRPFHAVSAATGENVQLLLYALDELLQALPLDPDVTDLDRLEIAPYAADRSFQVQALQPGAWRIESRSLERMAVMTKWDYYESALRFQRILAAWGIRDALQRCGVAEGDSVFIADLELIWGFDNVTE